MATQKELLEKAIVGIMVAYGLSRDNVQRLFDLTSENGKVRFVSIKNYNSDKSLNTEEANHLVSINVKNENVKEVALCELHSDTKMIKDYFRIQAEGWEYDKKYNLNGVSESDFRKQVIDQFEIALEELRHPKTSEELGRENNDIHIEGTPLYFNTNTARLSILGLSQKKTVVQQGVFKKVKSAPKTVAKQIINYIVKPHTDKYRRFALDNIKTIKMDGETLEIGGGQTEGVKLEVQ